jgi:hypothetical protein
MADNEFLNWELPSGDLTAADIAAFQENYKLAFEYYLVEGQAELAATSGYLTPGDLAGESSLQPIMFPSTIEELVLQLDADLRYEPSAVWVAGNLKTAPSDATRIKAAMEGSENLGFLALRLYKEFLAKKLVDEANAATGYDAGRGESETDPEAIESDPAAEDDREEQEALRAQALKKAEDEASRQVALIDDLQTAHFDEKHFVQSNLVNLIDLKLNVVDFYESKAFAYVDGKPNACIMMQGDPFNFLNQLTTYRDDLYFRMPSSEIANLQPKIRLYKSVPAYATTGESFKLNVPIHFDTSFTGANLQSLLENKNRRAVGVGIKSFSVDYTGVDAFSMHKSFEATLKIYAASMGELFKPRHHAPTGVMYRYIDLALMADPLKRPSKTPLSPKAMGIAATDVSALDFEIKAQLGISPLSNVGAAKATYDRVLKRNSVTLTMKAVEHSFKFVQANGAVELTIKYMPYVEKRFAGSDYNVLSDRESLKYKLKQELHAKIAEETCDAKVDEKQIKARIEEERMINTTAAANLIKEISCASKIRYLPLDAQIVQDFMDLGPKLDWGKTIKLAPYAAFVGKEGNQEALKKDIAKAATNTSKKFRGALQTGFTTPLTSSARFIYLGDLVDLLMAKMTKANSAGEMGMLIFELLEKDPDIKKFNASHPLDIESLIERFAQSSQDFGRLRVVLGPIEIVDPGSPSENIRVVSIGDLPIPVSLLLEYMVKMAGEKSTKHFDFITFITHLIKTTISNWLNDDTAFDGTLSQRVRIQSTTITAFDGQYEKDDLTQELVALNAKFKRADPSRVAGSAAGTPAVGDVKRIHAHRLYIDDMAKPALDTAPGKDVEDIDVRTETTYLVFYSTAACPIEATAAGRAERSVHSYMVGKDRGIIKDIQLDVYKDDGGMKALRYSQSNNAGLSQLHEIYNVNIKTYANLNMWPGTTIYVDPRGWVPDLDLKTRGIYGTVDAVDDLGLGGYYNVIKCGHVFERGNFETSIFAQWFSNGGTGPKLEDAERSSPAEAPVTKCGTGATTQPQGTDKKEPMGPCEGNSAHRLRALKGAYGIQQVARRLLVDAGDFGQHPSPTTNDTETN